MDKSIDERLNELEETVGHLLERQEDIDGFQKELQEISDLIKKDAIFFKKLSKMFLIFLIFICINTLTNLISRVF